MTTWERYPLAPADDTDRHDYEGAIANGDWISADDAIDVSDLLDTPTHPMPYDDMDTVLGPDGVYVTPYAIVGVIGSGNIEAILDADERRATGYDALAHDLPNLEIDPTEAGRLRAATRGEAA